MSSTISMDNIHLSPPPYEVLKAEWRVNALRKMLREAERDYKNLIASSRAPFLEPLSPRSVREEPLPEPPALERAPANHIWTEEGWIHQDSEAGRAIIQDFQERGIRPPPPELPLPASPESSEQEESVDETTEASSGSSTNSRKNIYWIKKTIHLIPELAEFSSFHRPAGMTKAIFGYLSNSPDKSMTFKELSEEIVKKFGTKDHILKPLLRRLYLHNEITLS